MLIACIGIQAAAPNNLYIFGNAPFGDWAYNPIASGKATQMTKSGSTFTWSGTISGTCYFAFCTQDGTSWDNLNNTYRYSATTQAISLNTSYNLSTGDRSMKLNAGDYTITVDWSGTTPKMTVTGYTPEIVITGYSVLGAKELFGGEGWEASEVDMTETSTGVYTATLSSVALVAGSYEYKSRANHEWGISEYPESGNNTLAIEEDGTYNIVFTLSTTAGTLEAVATKVGDEAPEVTDLYLIGEFNDWTQFDENYHFSPLPTGAFTFTAEGVPANVQFKFFDNNGTYYGSATWENEELNQDNWQNIALVKGGVDNNFYAGMAGNFVFTVDINNMVFTVEPVEEEVAAPEHLYILGDVQGWDPSSGAAEMTRTQISDGKYKYEFTGTFPAGYEGNTYFSFTSALASSSDAWDEIASNRYGAYNVDEAITADNTDPYDLKAGTNAFVLPAGTYRIELNWKEDGPDLNMWVHTEEAPEITDLYLIGSFCGWEGGVAMTKNGEGKYELEQALSAEDEFKFVDNLGNWYGANADGDLFWITADAHEGIDLNNTTAGKNFYMPNAGTYTFTVDLNNLKLDVAGDFSGGGEVNAPENLYILGTCQGWDPSLDIAMNKEGNTFTFDGWFADAGDGYSYFSFTSALASSADAWDEIADYRYGANSEADLEVAAGTYDLVKGTTAFKILAGEYTLTVNFTETGATLTISGEGGEQPDVDLYLVGAFNDWTPLDDNYKFSKNAEGKFEFTYTGYVANQQFKFVDSNSVWYGSATGANEEIGQDNHSNIALATGGIDDNFFATVGGDFKFVVDLANMKYDVEPVGDEPVVAAPEHLYILGNLQGWDPSNGVAEMTRTLISEGKYKYEYTGTFPEANEGNTYFSFTSALASSSDAWDEIASNRYGAYNADEAITADNTDPYDLKAGENAFVLPAGTYRIELNWKEDGPNLNMWVHTEEAPEPGDNAPEHLYILGNDPFGGWQPNNGTEMTKDGNSFTWSGNISEKAYFSFTNALAVNDGDNGGWDEITTNRYGAEENDKAVSGGNNYDVIYGNNENAFVIEPGEYTFTVTFTATGATLTIEGEEVPFVLPDCATWVEGKRFCYFEKPADWDESINAYTWMGASGAPAKAPQKASAAWPGDACEYVGTADNGNSVYRYAVDDTDFNMIIFNDGTNQTMNLEFTNGGYYRTDGLKAVVPEATGIDSLTNDERLTNGKIYNLQGMEVSKPTRGIYVINGKKVLFK